MFTKIEETDGLIRLADNGGNSALFEFIDMAVYNGSEYAVLLQQGDDMVLIMRYEESPDGHDRYFTVEDDEVFSKIYESFKQEFEDEFSFDG